jgi:hypothetical protein
VNGLVFWFSGQWWFKRGLFLQGGKALGGHICDGWAECEKEIGFADPYRATIRTVLRDSLSIPGYTGTTILRTFAPEHFEDGSWNSGGQCVRTAPGGVPISSLTQWMYDIQIEVFRNVTSMYSLTSVVVDGEARQSRFSFTVAFGLTVRFGDVLQVRCVALRRTGSSCWMSRTSLKSELTATQMRS